jgi:hypothetical protein
MTKLSASILSFALLAGMASLAAPSQAAPKFCHDLVQPVCAVTPAGARQTFTNACAARHDHARILHPGQCSGPICFSFKQVCARNPATHKAETFASLCLAENANATLLHEGPCK